MSVGVRPWRLLILVLLYFGLAYGLPAPHGVTAAGWRATAVLICVIVGFILRPLSNAGVVILGLAATSFVGSIPLSKVLAGYASPTVWLMLLALLMSRVPHVPRLGCLNFIDLRAVVGKKQGAIRTCKRV
jgi:di/tricarboxylate transporter